MYTQLRKIEHYFLISLLLFVSVGYSLQFILSSSCIMLHLWSTKASMVELSHSSQYIWVPRSLAEAYTWLHDFPFCKYQKVSIKLLDNQIYYQKYLFSSGQSKSNHTNHLTKTPFFTRMPNRSINILASHIIDRTTHLVTT